jgi:hypothetical protein
MRRRQKDLFDQPWVPIAAVIGVIAVIVIAIFFFMGSGGSSGQPAASASATPAPTSGVSSSATPAVSGKSETLNVSAIKELPTVSVPATGVYVKVNYLGSYSGKYGANGVLENVTDSGEKMYEIVNATGAVTAKFKKTDSSTKSHDLTVEIWKDGKVLKSSNSALPNAEVSVDYQL